MRNSNFIILSMEIVSLMERMGSVPIMRVKPAISIDKMIHCYGCCDIGHVEDVGDIADMPIGRNAIFVEDVEDVEDKTLPGCQADILSRIELKN